MQKFAIANRKGGTMQIIPLHPNDRVQLKKAHPCGGTVFRIVRVGSVVRVICESCGRDMNLDRIKLEKSIRTVVPATSTENSEQKGPSSNS